MSIITYENLHLFCYSNDKQVKSPKGLVLSFFGLGGDAMFGEDWAGGEGYTADNLVFVIPYTDPWNWMNEQAVTMTDEIVDALFDRYGWLEDFPIISTGGSMGGLCSLVYCRYAKRRPAACVANCPVCDLPYHYTERPDLPRTLYAAFYRPGTELTENLKAASPLHLSDSLPDIPYTIFHCTADKAVNIDAHSEKLVTALRAAGRDVTFVKVPDRGHCDLDADAQAGFRAAILAACGQ